MYEGFSSQGKGSNNASQHRGASVGKGDLDLPFKLFKLRKVKWLWTLNAILEGDKIRNVPGMHKTRSTHFSVTEKNSNLSKEMF